MDEDKLNLREAYDFDQDFAIQCKTKEEAEVLISFLNENGYLINPEDPDYWVNIWNHNKSDCLYFPLDGAHADINDMADNDNWFVYSFEEFFRLIGRTDMLIESIDNIMKNLDNLLEKGGSDEKVR